MIGHMVRYIVHSHIAVCKRTALESQHMVGHMVGYMVGRMFRHMVGHMARHVVGHMAAHMGGRTVRNHTAGCKR
jgi:hypothetical protein